MVWPKGKASGKGGAGQKGAVRGVNGSSTVSEQGRGQRGATGKRVKGAKKPRQLLLVVNC